MREILIKLECNTYTLNKIRDLIDNLLEKNKEIVKKAITIIKE